MHNLFVSFIANRYSCRLTGCRPYQLPMFPGSQESRKTPQTLPKHFTLMLRLDDASRERAMWREPCMLLRRVMQSVARLFHVARITKFTGCGTDFRCSMWWLITPEVADPALQLPIKTVIIFTYITSMINSKCRNRQQLTFPVFTE